MQRTDAAEPGKFGLDQLARIAQYRYLAAPPNVASPDEVPGGWGLLTYDDKRDTLNITKPANPSGKGEPARVLAEVARVNTQDLMMAGGVSWRRGKPVFPTTAAQAELAPRGARKDQLDAPPERAEPKHGAASRPAAPSPRRPKR